MARTWQEFITPPPPIPPVPDTVDTLSGHSPPPPVVQGWRGPAAGWCPGWSAGLSGIYSRVNGVSVLVRESVDTVREAWQPEQRRRRSKGYF